VEASQLPVQIDPTRPCVVALSLGDRPCLTLGERLDATVWTAATGWGADGRVRQIR